MTEDSLSSKNRCPFNWCFLEERAAVTAGFAAYERHPDAGGPEAQCAAAADEYEAAVETAKEEWREAVSLAKKRGYKRQLPSPEDSVQWRTSAGKKTRGHYILDRFRSIAAEVLKYMQPLLDEHPSVVNPSQEGVPETLVGDTDWPTVLAQLRQQFYAKVRGKKDPETPFTNWEDARWDAFERYGPHATGRALQDQFNAKFNRLTKVLARERVGAGGTPARVPVPERPPRPSQAPPARPVAAVGTGLDAGGAEAAMALAVLEGQRLAARQTGLLETLAAQRHREGQVSALRVEVEALGLLAAAAERSGDSAEARRVSGQLREAVAALAELRSAMAEAAADAAAAETAAEAAAVGRLDEEGPMEVALRKRVRLAGGVYLPVPAQPMTLQLSSLL
mmetsp:Transcript_33809/g.85181  ORF Transcript_33809/g.85181 Transcript_33809/m.85181 type:complete len:393 (-) Transcript_33809:17-1195(-)